MKYRILSGRNLDAGLVSAWRGLQDSNPDLASPYFCPEFTQIIAAVRSDVEVAVGEQDGKVASIFPFQRVRRSMGGPVGGTLSDFQGVISAPLYAIHPVELVQSCSLCVWDFDHLLSSQSSFVPFHRACEPSPRISLTSGFQAYAADLKAAGSDQIKQYGNLTRRLAREFGEVRFVSHSSEVKHLEQVIRWKSEQYRRTSSYDLFGETWIRETISRIHVVKSAGFGGTLSLLFAGERLLAGHVGMRSRTVWHYWFPAYDPEMAKYSPGLLLLLKMAEEANLLGLDTIDLGKGLSLYKERLMNASVSVSHGSVGLPSWVTSRRKGQKWLRQLVANSPLATPARSVARWARQRSRPVQQ